MPDLFGLDIAGIVNDAISSAGGVRSGILKIVTPGTRTSGSLTAGTNSTEMSHTFKGFVENKAKRRKGQLQAETVPVLTILGASVSPLAVPTINDKALMDGVEYTLLELLGRDPAAAVYEFRVGS